MIHLVTGANRGIGKQIALDLSRKIGAKGKVILTAREEKDGKETFLELSKAHDCKNVEYHQLDITSWDSITALEKWLKEKYGKLDVLINNAGFATKGSDFNREIAQKTVRTNYNGTRRVTEALLPLIPKGGRIINVSSGAGAIGDSYSEEKMKFLKKNDMEIKELDDFVEKFYIAADGGREKAESEGFPANTYKLSKVALNCWTRIMARDFKDKGIYIYSVCPGWVRTRMGGDNASRNVEKGAETPVWLATEPVENLKHGAFYRDKKEMEY